jgi:hypothetical protein
MNAVQAHAEISQSHGLAHSYKHLLLTACCRLSI